MSTSGKRMTTLMHQATRLLAVWLAVALIGPHPFALAQAVPGGSPARSSVLSTGGGQALLDPSDTVILLLDHQAGLFQTVKDISVAELRANTRYGNDSRENGPLVTLAKNPAQWKHRHY
jgi:hypothetical protein